MDRRAPLDACQSSIQGRELRIPSDEEAPPGEVVRRQAHAPWRAGWRLLFYRKPVDRAAEDLRLHALAGEAERVGEPDPKGHRAVRELPRVVQGVEVAEDLPSPRRRRPEARAEAEIHPREQFLAGFGQPGLDDSGAELLDLLMGEESHGVLRR
jgi:hypothetical protein